MKSLGVGIIGYNGIGKLHAYSFLNLPFYYNNDSVKVKLIGVCTKNLKNAKKAKRQIGFKFATDNYVIFH